MTGYIALGSNLGDRRVHLRAGLDGLERGGLRLTRISSVWETEPVGVSDPRFFWNMVVEIETGQGPQEVLDLALAVEREAGRERSGSNESRTLDLDLLLLGDVSVCDGRLQLPHPRMWARSFVLAPLAEIVPQLRNPSSGLSVVDELARIAHPTRVCRIGALDRCPTVLL